MLSLCRVDITLFGPSPPSACSSLFSAIRVSISRVIDDRLITSRLGRRCKVIVLTGSRSRTAWRQLRNPLASGSVTSMLLVADPPDGQNLKWKYSPKK